MIRDWLSGEAKNLIRPEIRLILKTIILKIKENIDRACLWRWTISSTALDGNEPYKLVYIGRRSTRPQAMAQFFRSASKHYIAGDKPSTQPAWPILIGDFPTPGSLRVPVDAHAVIALNRSLKEIAVPYGDNLRRTIKQQRSHSEVRHLNNIVDIDQADQDMLRPYAASRYGPDAAQIGESVVRKMALQHGRLDAVYQNGEPVSCHLAFGTVRGKKKYWNSMRFGFSKAVFEDSKRLRAINSINIQLAVEWAIDHKFDYFDIGMSLAQPDDGLLQWKRRRGGQLDSTLTHAYFHVRLPKQGVAQFLWNSPLFDDKSGALSLHFGLPAHITDEEALSRYNEMGFGGLTTVCIHHARPLSETLLNAFQELFSDHLRAPVFKTIAVVC